MQRAMIGMLLEESGYDVVQCESAEAAELVLEKNAGALCLLMTDVQLAGRMDGVELAYFAKERNPRLDVVVTSGRPLTQPLPEGPSSGQKPWRPWMSCVRRRLRSRPLAGSGCRGECLSETLRRITNGPRARRLGELPRLARVLVIDPAVENDLDAASKQRKGDHHDQTPARHAPTEQFKDSHKGPRRRTLARNQHTSGTRHPETFPGPRD